MGTYAVNFQGPAEAAAALDAAGLLKVGTTGPFPPGPERYAYVIQADSAEAARDHIGAVLGDVQIRDLTVRGAS